MVSPQPQKKCKHKKLRGKEILEQYEAIAKQQVKEQAEKYLGTTLENYLDDDEEVCICCAKKEKGYFPQLKIPIEGTEYKEQFLMDQKK